MPTLESAQFRNPAMLSQNLPPRKRITKESVTIKWQPVEMPPQPPSPYPSHIPQKFNTIPIDRYMEEYPLTPNSSLGMTTSSSKSSETSSVGSNTSENSKTLYPSLPTISPSKTKIHNDSSPDIPSLTEKWQDDDRPRKQRRMSTSVKREKETSTQKQQHSEQSDEEMLYCICRKPYDANRFMIACDRCDQWFHGDCVGISEKQGEFVDLYFCPDCAEVTGKTTSWKSQCANPACHKPARNGSRQATVSKYCSETCGIQAARARLEHSDTKRRSSSQSLLDSSESETTELSRSRLCSFADLDDRERLLRIRNERTEAKNQILLVERKLTFLNAILRLNNSSPSEQCKFDSRLAWSDDKWEAVNSVEVTPSAVTLKFEDDDEQGAFSECRLSRKCGKHSGWQKLKESELEQERAEQFTILSMLARERKQIKLRIQKRRQDIAMTPPLVNGTVCHSK